MTRAQADYLAGWAKAAIYADEAKRAQHEWDTPVNPRYMVRVGRAWAQDAPHALRPDYLTGFADGALAAFGHGDADASQS